MRKQARTNLIGSKILKVEHLSENEIEYLMWGCDPLDTLVFTLDNGMEMLVMSDQEGNNAGWISLLRLDPVHGSVITSEAAEYKKTALTTVGAA